MAVMSNWLVAAHLRGMSPCPEIGAGGPLLLDFPGRSVVGNIWPMRLRLGLNRSWLQRDQGQGGTRGLVQQNLLETPLLLLAVGWLIFESWKLSWEIDDIQYWHFRLSPEDWPPICA